MPAPTFCPAPVTNAVLSDRSNIHLTLTDPSLLAETARRQHCGTACAAPVAPGDNTVLGFGTARLRLRPVTTPCPALTPQQRVA